MRGLFAFGLKRRTMEKDGARNMEDGVERTLSDRSQLEQLSIKTCLY
jgi:hypothetical protein